MKNRILLSISVILLVLLFWQSMPSDKAKVIFCDVGQGDGAVFIKGNFQIVIDAGPPNKKMVNCLARYIPFWDKNIEIFITSHDDKDHIGGLVDINKSYKIDHLYNYKNINNNESIKVNNIYFDVLSSTEEALIGILRYTDKNILFMGDATKDVEIEVNEEVDILKVGHHGSDTSTGELLLNSIKTKLAIISVGRNNQYGHPKQVVLDRLNKYGIEIKRTDLEGDIVIE